MSTTGYAFDNLPEGIERDHVLRLIRVGVLFSRRDRRKPDAFTLYLADLVRDMKTPTFDFLLFSLDLACTRTDPTCRITIQRVDRVWSVVKYHDLRRGDFEIGFPALRNKLTAAKKAQFTGNGKQ